MHSICLALVAFVSFLLPPLVHASQLKPGVIALDSTSVSRLRQKVDLLSRESISQRSRSRSSGKVQPRESRAGGAPQPDQTFFGFDGHRTYPLRLPANSDQLEIIGDAVARAPEGQITVNLTEMKTVHDLFAEHLTRANTTRAPRGRQTSPKRAWEPRRASRSASHSPNPAHSPSRSSQRRSSKKRSPSPFPQVQHTGAGGFLGAEPDAIAAALEAAAAGVQKATIPVGRNTSPSKIEQLHPDYIRGITDYLSVEDTYALSHSSHSLEEGMHGHRQARLRILREATSIEELDSVLQLDGVPMRYWEPIEHQRIEQVARHHLEADAPEKAYEVLMRNGVTMEHIERLEELPVYQLFLEAALETGRSMQVLYATDNLLGRHLYDSKKRRSVIISGAAENEIKLLNARAKIATQSSMPLKRRGRGTRGHPTQHDDGPLELRSIIRSARSSESLKTRAEAVKAKRPIAPRKEGDFLAWGPSALNSKHLSKAEKNHIRYRLAQIYTKRFDHRLSLGRDFKKENFTPIELEDLEKATTYYKQLLDQVDVRHPLYANALNLIILINKAAGDYLEDVIYKALYNEQVPLSIRSQVRAFNKARSRGQRSIPESDAFPASKDLSSYVSLEEARKLLDENKIDEASRALRTLAESNTKDSPLPKELQKVTAHYQAMIELRRARTLATTDPEAARTALRKGLDAGTDTMTGKDPVLRAEYMAERSMLYSQLEDYDAAMNDLWQVLEIYMREPYHRRGNWEKSLLNPTFETAYTKFMEASSNGENLSRRHHHHLSLIQATQEFFTDPMETKPLLIKQLDDALEAKFYTKQQQATAQFLKAALPQEDTTLWSKTLEGEALLFPHDRALVQLNEGYHRLQSNEHLRAIHHLRAALRLGGLDGQDTHNARTWLAMAYERTKNPEFVPDIIELLTPSSPISKHSSRKPFQQAYLTFARALEQYARPHKHSRYPHQSFKYYTDAKSFTSSPAEAQHILKERTDHEFHAILRNQRHSRREWDIDDVQMTYEELLKDLQTDKAEDLRTIAQVHLNLGRLKYKRTPNRLKNGQERLQTVLDHYAKVNAYRQHLNPSEAALLDLEKANAYHDYLKLWERAQLKGHNSKSTVALLSDRLHAAASSTPEGIRSRVLQEVRERVELPLQRAFDSGQLKGTDLLSAYRRLAKIKQDYRKYDEAYAAYESALKVEGVTVPELIRVRRERAHLVIPQKHWDYALIDYDEALKYSIDDGMNVSGFDRQELYLERAQMRYLLGDYETALRELEEFRSWRKSKGNFEVDTEILAQKSQLHALILSRLGYAGQARRAFDAYVESRSGNPGTAQLLRQGGIDDREFFRTFLVDQWIAGAEDFDGILDTYRFDYRGKVPDTTLYSFFSEALKVQENLPRSTTEQSRGLAELKKQVETIKTPAFQNTLMKNQRRPLLRSAHLNLAQAQLQLKHYDDAERSLRQIMPLTGKEHPLQPKISSRLNVLQARRLAKKEKHQAALDVLDRIPLEHLDPTLKNEHQRLMQEAKEQVSKSF